MGKRSGKSGDGGKVGKVREWGKGREGQGMEETVGKVRNSNPVYLGGLNPHHAFTCYFPKTHPQTYNCDLTL